MDAIQALVPLRNDLPPLENSIIRMVMLVALAERAVQEDNQSIWLQNNDLNKRRAIYHYDKHLQQMINYVGQIGCFATRTIKCGNSGLHKAELYTTIDEEHLIVHMHNSFNPQSGYNRVYLNMNTNPNRKRYAYVEYHLDSSKQNVNSLQWVVPDVSGELNGAFTINLLPVLHRIRRSIQGTPIERVLQQFNTIEYYIGEN